MRCKFTYLLFFNRTVNDQVWTIKSFDSILQLLGHRNKTIDVLKLDIEGVEYLVIEDLLDKGFLNVSIHINESMLAHCLLPFK